MRFLIPIAIVSGVFLILATVLYLFRFDQKRFRSSFTPDLMQSPGQSLLPELDAINDDLMVYILSALFVPLAIYALHISISYFGTAEETALRLVTSVSAALAFFIFSICKAVRLLNKRRRVRLDYEGALAVGQALNQLMHAGFYIYHDFHIDNFDIAHIVVGPKGVFAVATNAGSIPTFKNRMEDATVEYDGRMLYFPKGEDFQIIEQAEKQASRLSDWLGKAVGKPIAARAIVALPGWFVKRTSSEGIPVVNPKQFSSLFEHIKPRPLSDSMITRINHRLNQKCRDLEPKSKNFKN